MTTQYVSYLREATKEHDRCEFDLDAQRQAVAASIGNGKVMAEYREIESGKKFRQERPQLTEAIALCRENGATLIVAKLDRLSLDIAFLIQLNHSGVPFVCADIPQANNQTLGIMLHLAEQQRKSISRRIKKALTAARSRGVKLGCPQGAAHLRKYGNNAAVAAIKAKAERTAESLRETLKEIHAAGITGWKAIADELNHREIPTPRGGKWHPTSVARLAKRLRQPADNTGE